MSKKQSIANDNKPVEETYKMMKHHDHILEIPDTIIGSIEPDKMTMWINDESGTMIQKEITYVPGLFKIYDEIIVNAHDHSMRPNTGCKTIKVTIDKESGEISVWNDGKGIPVQIHKEHGIYIPEMIFGNLLTSSNYGQKGKFWGGKNGYGAKAANIFSKHFYVETVDGDTGKKYVQHFYNNMYKKDKPEITDAKTTKPYTKITFIPDYARFKLDGLTDDIVGLFRKRVYDLAAVDCKRVKVYLNDKLLEIETFKDYMKLFYPSETTKMTCRDLNQFWKIGVVYTPDAGFSHMSHVNGCWTYSQAGGTHVSHVCEQLMKGLLEYIKGKFKDVDVKPSYLKENMAIFIDFTTENPAFNSQTKDYLTTKISEFTKKCELDDNFILSVAGLGIIDDAVEFAKLKGSAELKKTDGKKVKRILDEKKLIDANWAGTRKSKECRLIITEGDSAAPFAIAGLDIIGREKYGVFPIRGKMLNVRDAPSKQILKNEEIKQIKKIIGLQQGVVYNESNIDKLRYGGIFLLADADVDGYHIMGLVINFIETFWPELLQIKGFFQTMNTPIIKAYKKSDVKAKHSIKFYTMCDYNKWRDEMGVSINKWQVDYFKGLGSSDDNAARDAFKDFEKKLLSFIWEPGTVPNKPISDKHSDEKSEKSTKSETEKDSKNAASETSKSHDAIMLAFSKALVYRRKQWLEGYDRNVILTPKNQEIPYSEFVNKQLIHFSNDDNLRSIPSICDGLKPSQRKIMYHAMVLNIDRRTRKMKVNDFAADVSSKTSYIHGPTSLCDAIANMAQNFAGSNNINLLYPDGQFGHRRDGGSAVSSPRYTHTFMECLTKLIFRKEDTPIYNYLTEENKLVEPEVFAPIIPLVLVNGARGIGTGYSTFIPNYNPKDIIANILRILQEEEPKRMKPWYKGYKGKITSGKDDYTFISSGIYEVLDEYNIKITELPIGMCPIDYEEFLKGILINAKDPKKTQIIDDYKNMSGNDTIDFTVTFSGHTLQKLIKSGTLESKLKLTSSLPTSNMYLYNEDGKMTKYDVVEDILRDFCEYRLNMYTNRKEYYTKLLKNELKILTYKIKFIRKKIEKEIIIEDKKKATIIARLVELGFPKLSHDINAVDTDKDVEDDDEVDTLENNDDVQSATKKSVKTYDYITTMSLFSLSREKIEELEKQHADKKAELELYENTSIQDIWKMELKELADAYEPWLENELIESEASSNENKKRIAKKTTVRRASAKKEKDAPEKTTHKK